VHLCQPVWGIWDDILTWARSTRAEKAAADPAVHEAEADDVGP